VAKRDAENKKHYKLNTQHQYWNQLLMMTDGSLYFDEAQQELFELSGGVLLLSQERYTMKLDIHCKLQLQLQVKMILQSKLNSSKQYNQD